MYSKKGKNTAGGRNSHSFARIPSANIQRSQFNRSHGHKTTLFMGVLTPIFVDEALPGDTLNLDTTLFGRLATPLHPIMDNLYIDTHFFAVPNRLLWDNWEKFMGAQDDPGDSIDFLVPTLPAPAGGFTETNMADYFGIPTKEDNFDVNALHFRAYNKIWNTWFRDENLQDSVPDNMGDGPDIISDYILQYRGKRHDYFTSCLPFPQKGPSVELPLGSTAPLQFTGDAQPLFSNIGDATVRKLQAVDASQNLNLNIAHSGGGALELQWINPKLEVDLSSATAATINQLRQAFQIQRLYERDARGGTRYTELLRSHFGVVSPDQRLQRPEYLGGSSTPMEVISVPQTDHSVALQTPQGNLAGFGLFRSGKGHGFNKSFTEHCVIIGFVSVRADINYQQGLNRMWSRQTKHDYYWPTLAHLGEQAVLSKEIYMDGTANDEDVFGYQERFAEYRYKPSLVTSEMRSNASSSVDTWHLAQDFVARPLLNDAFIIENPPIARVIAVPNDPTIIMDCAFNYKCARPMPLYSVPGQIDRF